ncbi:alpha/beta fold hydrolase [Solimonas marina]|uniref:Alpha/beta fold hydrolase n=1 Tax=Solimonas marina TaxID=2714601 RepID=A0A969W7M3_9GAMM|nr:alpha/beta fold hydrolase [Solimonas marina]NKF22112.1 alpha/beta fold hydrolase [Solimonas marina]
MKSLYARIGAWLYRLAQRAESRRSGLRAAVVDVGDSRMMTWQGGADRAETIVMIHGYSADKAVWMRFARPFSARYRLLIVDLPGHGETAFDPALQYDTTAQARRVIKAMDVLGIQRAHVIGNSMGGFIAARMAHDFPERVSSATLIDAAGITAPQDSDLQKMLDAGRNPFLVHTRAEFDTFYAMTMARPPWMPRITTAALAQDYMRRRDSLARIFSDFNGVYPLDAQLADIRVPVLVMWGALDRILHVSMTDVWADGIPGAQRIVYPDLGHMPMLEAPGRSARDIGAFIAAHAA